MNKMTAHYLTRCNTALYSYIKNDKEQNVEVELLNKNDNYVLEYNDDEIFDTMNIKQKSRLNEWKEY